MPYVEKSIEKTIEGAHDLRMAATLIERAMGGLDLSTKPCGCCGVIRNLYWNHKKVHDILSGLPQRLRRIADTAPYNNKGSESDPRPALRAEGVEVQD